MQRTTVQRTTYGTSTSVKIKDNGLSFFLFFFSHFILFLFFIFLFLELWGLGLEVICYTVTSVTSDRIVTTLITGLKRKK